jgi:hypothetical protein
MSGMREASKIKAQKRAAKRKAKMVWPSPRRCMKKPPIRTHLHREMKHAMEMATGVERER